MGGGRLGDGAGEDSYLASVSDLMVGMLFIFIIMLMAFALNFRTAEQQAAQTRTELDRARAAATGERDAVTAERDRLARERDEVVRRDEALGEVSARLTELDARRTALLGRLALDLGEREVPVTLDARDGVLRLPESLLFDSGRAELRAGGERAIRLIAERLAAALPCYSEAPPALRGRQACPAGAGPLLEAVLVEGHTDDVPLRGGAGPMMDNWALSAARGVSTFKALTRYAPDLELLANPRGEALLGVAGYEARRPVASGDTAEARRLNRRIDLRFLVAAPDDAELGDLVRRLGGGGER